MPLSSLLSFKLFERNRRDDNGFDKKSLSSTTSSSTLTPVADKKLSSSPFLPPGAAVDDDDDKWFQIYRRIKLLSNWPVSEDRYEFLIGYFVPLFAICAGSLTLPNHINRLVLKLAGRQRGLEVSTRFPIEHLIYSVALHDLCTFHLVMPSILMPKHDDATTTLVCKMSYSDWLLSTVNQTLIGWSFGLLTPILITVFHNWVISKRYVSISFQLRTAFLHNRPARLMIGGLMAANLFASSIGVYSIYQSRDRAYSALENIGSGGDDDVEDRRKTIDLIISGGGEDEKRSWTSIDPISACELSCTFFELTKPRRDEKKMFEKAKQERKKEADKNKNKWVD